MLQIDHIYEFFYKTLFKDFCVFSLPNGVPINLDINDIKKENIHIFNHKNIGFKIFFWDQEPVLNELTRSYIDYFKYQADTNKKAIALVSSEYSKDVDQLVADKHLKKLYYFFHGFAALDWYRGFYALNYAKPVIKNYTYDYITFNRLVSADRSYRCYFVSCLFEQSLTKHGQISFGLKTEQPNWQEEINDLKTKLSTQAIEHIKQHLSNVPLIIDNEHILGSASADIPRNTDAFWHIVTETVFYYDKLHLTEKIFKPIVSKQPFMLLGAPGNLSYLRSYGFKTFDDIIDESYDTIQDPWKRIDAVTKQLTWYCSLSDSEKQDVIYALEPIIEHNFHHFYGEFKHIITRELVDNTKALFHEIGYDDQHINYHKIYHALTR